MDAHRFVKQFHDTHATLNRNIDTARRTHTHIKTITSACLKLLVQACFLHDLADCSIGRHDGHTHV